MALGAYLRYQGFAPHRPQIGEVLFTGVQMADPGLAGMAAPGFFSLFPIIPLNL